MTGVDKFGRNLLKIEEVIRKAAYITFASINGVTVVGAAYGFSVGEALSNGTAKKLDGNNFLCHVCHGNRHAMADGVMEGIEQLHKTVKVIKNLH